VKYVIKY